MSACTASPVPRVPEEVTVMNHLHSVVPVPSGAVEQTPCATHDPELFFAERPDDVEAAKSLCVPCPLREACLAGALERREPWGVWGGQLVLAGVVVPRKRPRGRPRKEVAA